MPLQIAPPTTDAEIIRMATGLVGKSSANQVASGGAFSQNAQEFYNTLVSGELGSNRWRFALKEEPMAILTTLEPSFDGWLYYWEIPAECLMFLRVASQGGGVGNAWTVFGDRVLTRSNTNLTAVFCRNVPVSKWPPAFALYIVYALADMLAVSVTNSDRMVARIAKGLAMWQSRALFADGQNSPVRSMRSRPWINARFAFRTQNGGGNA